MEHKTAVLQVRYFLIAYHSVRKCFLTWKTFELDFPFSWEQDNNVRQPALLGSLDLSTLRDGNAATTDRAELARLEDAKKLTESTLLHLSAEEAQLQAEIAFLSDAFENQQRNPTSSM